MTAPSPISGAAVSRRRAQRGRGSLARNALTDVREGARQWPQWFTLGNLEIKLRFRRTGLGPVWSSLSFAILIGALAFVYGRVLGVGVRVYAPHLALGLLVWTFLATVLVEACDVFVHAAHTLKQLYLPRSTFLFRLLWRNLVLLSFNMMVAGAVLVLCRVPVSLDALLALAGLALLSLNLLWLATLLALAGARVWAVSRAVQTGLPIAMLVTPIIWLPTRGTLRIIAEWNPLFYAIELVRGPLLGHPPAAAAWLGALASGLAGSLLAFAAFARWRDRIAYWI